MQTERRKRYKIGRQKQKERKEQNLIMRVKKKCG